MRFRRMDYSRLIEVSQNSRNLTAIDTHYQANIAQYPYLSQHVPNANPGIDAQTHRAQIHGSHLAQAGVGNAAAWTDSYDASGAYAQASGYQPTVAYTYQSTEQVPSVYYHDTNNAAQQYGVSGSVSYAAGVTIPATGADQYALASYNSALWANAIAAAAQYKKSSGWTKRPKKAKVVQSAWCEVCKVQCTNHDILKQHKLGKKHKRNLEKLNPPKPVKSSAKPVIGPQEKPVNSEKKSKMVKETAEDLETKRRKLLESGVAAQAIKMCSLCNVICNSQTVYDFHIAGQKHVAKVKKQQEPVVEVATAS